MVQVTNMTPGSASQPYVLDQNKCVMLALIHDLAEAIVLASECAAPGHEVVLGLGCIVAFALPLILFIPNSLTY